MNFIDIHKTFITHMVGNNAYSSESRLAFAFIVKRKIKQLSLAA